MNNIKPDIVSITKSALKFLSGDESLVCRLCISSIESEINSVSIEDSVTLDRYFFEGTVTFDEIFQALGIGREKLLPTVLCMDCGLKMIDSYLFQLFCQYSNSKWGEIFSNLEKFTPQPNEPHATTKNVYIVADNPNLPWIACAKSLNEKTSENAVVQLKNSISNRKKNINKRKLNRTCKKCGQTYEDHRALRKHMKKDHFVSESRNYRCPKCAKVFLKEAHFKNHVERLHLTKTIPCSLCEKKFSTKQLLHSHIKQFHTPMDCPTCLLTLPSRYEMLRHSELHKTIKCPNCLKTFASQRGLKEHQLHTCRVVITRSLFICDICGRDFKAKNSVRNHIQVEHGFGKLFSCKFCDKKFSAMSSLKQHEVKHTKEKKFSCELCGGLFVTFAGLTYHKRIHTGERPYPCDECDERFLSASRRMAHKYNKHLGLPKQCPLCPSRFITAHHLKKHCVRHYNPQSKLFIPNLNHEISINS